ncbi:MAG: NAD-dependent succinate-semialdehyde dehydrogenase [Asticcacaulis sp.]|uniref:NAD-dependent succinate-semialdehyde dehydrogenase n=1 Tax=Asticcacaulis sp. TaxID=1872648 RepID=UPI0039E3A361
MTSPAFKREQCLINGAWQSGDPWIAVTNPATGATIGRVPALAAEAARQAIDAAEAALPLWRAKTAGERARILKRMHALMIEHQEALAVLLTEEQGKPLTEARGEIAYAASFLEWFAEEARRVYGDVIPGHAPDKRNIVLKQPIGVVAAITPWNFPSAMITRKIGPALAAGCTVVVKPAEQTPFSALALGVIAEMAGLPAGVLNIITGDPITIGGELTASAKVRKISFTGSTTTGIKLMAQSAPTIKKLSLELGGNAPFIVFDDADLDAAVEGAMLSKFRNAGQTCVCANRIYVQAKVHDAFVDKLTQAVRGLKIGDGRNPDNQIGPLIDDAAVAKVESHVADAVTKGGQVRTGGQRLEGLFYQPTLITGVTPDMRVTQEETFGPLAAITRFETDDEAIQLANATEFGLAAYVYVRDISRVWKIVETVESGMVGVNTGLISTEVAPFGGVKASGLGREGSYYGIEDYLEVKYVCFGL